MMNAYPEDVVGMIGSREPGELDTEKVKKNEIVNLFYTSFYEVSYDRP